MAEEKKAAKLPHNLILENRKNLHLSGVEDVESFDEQTVIAYTGLGQLVIRGKELHVSKLKLDSVLFCIPVRSGLRFVRFTMSFVQSGCFFYRVGSLRRFWTFFTFFLRRYLPLLFLWLFPGAKCGLISILEK